MKSIEFFQTLVALSAKVVTRQHNLPGHRYVAAYQGQVVEK